MKPERKETIDGHVVEEFYWAGAFVVYVDNERVDGVSFEDACLRVDTMINRGMRIWADPNKNNR
jgi:hypothetical protein